jgi:hypothetical protein
MSKRQIKDAMAPTMEKSKAQIALHDATIVVISIFTTASMIIAVAALFARARIAEITCKVVLATIVTMGLTIITNTRSETKTFSAVIVKLARIGFQGAIAHFREILSSAESIFLTFLALNGTIPATICIVNTRIVGLLESITERTADGATTLLACSSIDDDLKAVVKRQMSLLNGLHCTVGSISGIHAQRTKGSLNLQDCHFYIGAGLFGITKAINEFVFGSTPLEARLSKTFLEFLDGEGVQTIVLKLVDHQVAGIVHSFVERCHCQVLWFFYFLLGGRRGSCRGVPRKSEREDRRGGRIIGIKILSREQEANSGLIDTGL